MSERKRRINVPSAAAQKINILNSAHKIKCKKFDNIYFCDIIKIRSSGSVNKTVLKGGITMIQGVNGNNPTASQLFQSNQADANKGQYQNISGPNDVADKTAALTLNTVNTLNQGLVDALNQSTANLNQSVQNLQSSGNAANQQQYNNGGQPITVGANQSGNLLSKIV
jgi:hypothetical protein